MSRQDNNSEKQTTTCIVELSGLVASLNRIFNTVSASGLSDNTMLALEDDIKVVSERFGINSKAAVLLAAILNDTIKSGCEDSDLSVYVRCSNIEFIGFHSAIQDMENLGVICSSPQSLCRYMVSREALRAIENDTEFVPIKQSGLSGDELFNRFRLLFAEYRHNRIDCDHLLGSMEKLIDNNKHLLFCRKTSEALSNPSFCETEKRFFLALCYRYVCYGDKAIAIDRLLKYINYYEDEQAIRRSLCNGHSDLQHSGLVVFGGDDGFQDTSSLALSDDVRKNYFQDVTIATEPEVSYRDLTPSTSIKPKDLFYDGKVAEQMGRLASLLDPENFKGVQERLTKMGMRKGFAILFSGGAGCGKTAGAYEIARRTGRDIFAVDMSELKSKWVGDSEKIVKGVFTTYRKMCETKPLAPILLFNEADAIFSKRMENPQDSVDQMMNAIQNICLDAIENLEGILIATTNLASNFCDDAFARRFLFKVEFERPEAATRAKIWRSMMDDISEEDALTLANKYDFSGGNIENIVRKSVVGYVISGKKASLCDLISFCDEELLSSCRHCHIGFR